MDGPCAPFLGYCELGGVMEVLAQAVREREMLKHSLDLPEAEKEVGLKKKNPGDTPRVEMMNPWLWSEMKETSKRAADLKKKKKKRRMVDWENKLG